MKIIRNTITIADLYKYYNDGDLIINKDYQREKGLWPNNARSYFIDTILNGFPFPKMTLRQKIDLRTKSSIREIIDGQQRFTTINDFINNKLKLSRVSKNFSNFKYIDIPEDIQSGFLAYEVSVDTVVGASVEEVVDIFRRINSYTLPLNKQEQRHASYQGRFKWYIKEIIDQFSPMLEQYKILSEREITRMVDADLFTELCQVLIDGIITRNPKKLDNVYKDNDKEFEREIEINDKLLSTLNFIKTNFVDILQTELISGYTFYSLFSALVYNKWGIINIHSEEFDGLQSTDRYCNNEQLAQEKIIEMLNDLDKKKDDGYNAQFVKAGLKTTHSITNRTIRLINLVRALQIE